MYAYWLATCFIVSFLLRERQHARMTATHIEIIRIILMPYINSAILLVLQVCVKFSPYFFMCK